MTQSASDYGQTFRDAYSLLHGGRPEEFGTAAERAPGEPLDAYLARSRAEAVGAMRKRLLAERPPAPLEEPNRLLLALLANAAQVDAALGEQVRAYQCGQFHESVGHSERLQALVTESARLDRELLASLAGLDPRLREEIGIAGVGED